MAKAHERVFILIIAFVFFITSIGVFAGLILESNQRNKLAEVNNSSQSSETDAIEQATPKEGALEGTKLANFTPVEKIEQLKIEDLVVGTGEEVQPGATITAHYTGALAKDGTIFQSSLDMGQPVTFGLDQVIAGWTNGVPGMKVGGKRRLLIPAEQAYGANSPSPSIPANADLVFDIELTAIEPRQ